jgi:hypothetical protein
VSDAKKGCGADEGKNAMMSLRAFLPGGGPIVGASGDTLDGLMDDQQIVP